MGEQQRTAAARRGKRVNTFPASVLSMGCTGRLRASWVIHLGALEAAGATVDGSRRRGVARERRQGRVGARRQRGRGKNGW
jgi:hypothetical protein